jgi:hypothetical protein
MPAGLQVFNPDGSLQFDSSRRTYRVLTQMDLGATNSGSTSIAGVTPGASVRAVATPTSQTGQAPTIGVSGNSISWDYRGQTRQNQHVLLLEY